MSLLAEAIAKRLPDAQLSGSFESVTGITMDSRAIKPGDIFACVKGTSFDGHSFASQAIAQGAVALLVDSDVDVDAPTIKVDNVRSSLGPLSALVYGDPSEELKVIGITGTNGKSSVVQLLKDIFDLAGIRSDLYGTLTGERTTSEAPGLQAQLAQSVASGIEVVAMEVSSHALEMRRVDGTKFAAAVFTNLSHDHLDFHGSMEAYFQAKARLFEEDFAQLNVVNADDEHGERLVHVGNTMAYSLGDIEDLTIRGAVSKFKWRGQEIELNLLGTHNVMNALAAASVAAELGVEVEVIAQALSKSKPIKGRLDLVDGGQDFIVAVDYAHTPDALAAVIKAAREIAGDKKVITLFGCGGDRDAKKRPIMGKIASEQSDVAILTTDNPRSEDAIEIATEVLAGVDAAYEIWDIPDRAEAITTAINMAEAGDVILVTGKGHETGQYVGDKVLEFDDIEVSTKALEDLLRGPAK